jgi:aspartate kinase
VVGVASERDTFMLEFSGAGRATHDLLALLDEHGVAGKQLRLAADRLTLIISRENLHEEARVREALARTFGDAVRLADDLGAVSVVGAGINASFRNLRRGSDTLEAAGIALRGVATSSFRITWMIARDRLNDAVRALHQIFIDQP